MKLKVYFLLAALWAAPMKPMDKPLLIRAHRQNVMQRITAHPRFIELKAKFARIGGRIKVIIEDKKTINTLSIYVNREIECYVSGTFFPSDIYFDRIERSINYYQNIWSRKMLPRGLQALCIVTLANEHKKKNKEIIAGVATLPEDLKKQILFLADKNEEIL